MNISCRVLTSENWFGYPKFAIITLKFNAMYSLKSNEAYSSFSFPFRYPDLGYSHNSGLYETFTLLNRIGDQFTTARLTEIANEETKKGVAAGIYPAGSEEQIAAIYSILNGGHKDIDAAISQLRSVRDKVQADRRFTNTIVEGFANLALESTTFWRNFVLDNNEVGDSAARYEIDWGRTLFVAGSDLLGGLATGYKGGQAGLKIGTAFGQPVAGVAIGAIGGALLGGAVASGTAYYGSR